MAITHTPVPLAIIGGGAAGLFAAAVAAERGLGCLVFERKARPGAKMLMTANGRCNFTKDIPPERMLADLGEPVASFARTALMACPPLKIAGGFKRLGVNIKRMADGRLFPASEKAADIVHAFGDLLRDREVPLLVNCPVTGIQPMRTGFIVAAKAFTVWAETVLVATGGVSFPKTGSVGDGQAFARALGHRVEPLRAGLVGYEMRPPRVARYEAALARVRVGSVVKCEYRGEVEFERWGVTGAAVYNCQRWVARNLEGRGGYELELEFGGDRLTLRNPVARPVKEAIVTIGGVSRDEVDPETMESRKVPGLYFAGEVLDIDGPTGGYNLSLAFATARLAVTSICARRASSRA
ncbi:MAG: NAD(P)/FAD-dependent oxidoreductase [Kiritimatiellia bacterium]